MHIQRPFAWISDPHDISRWGETFKRALEHLPEHGQQDGPRPIYDDHFYDKDSTEEHSEGDFEEMWSHMVSD
jgi:hypothetical protein